MDRHRAAVKVERIASSFVVVVMVASIHPSSTFAV